MKEYETIPFGEHKGVPINEVPLEYLIWLVPKIQNRTTYRVLYFSTVKFLLTLNVKVEDGKFYFKDFEFLTVGGMEQPFLYSTPLKNSNGENIYMVGKLENPVFIKKEEENYSIASGYATIPYKYGKSRMVVEYNPEYYFTDSFEQLWVGAFLMKKPHLPEESNITFSKNLLTKNIK